MAEAVGKEGLPTTAQMTLRRVDYKVPTGVEIDAEAVDGAMWHD